MLGLRTQGWDSENWGSAGGGGFMAGGRAGKLPRPVGSSAPDVCPAAPFPLPQAQVFPALSQPATVWLPLVPRAVILCSKLV